MSFTSSCPKCLSQVVVPDGVNSDAVVRCPLCQSEYPISEAIALAPPSLIIVSFGSPTAAELAQPMALPDEEEEPISLTPVDEAFAPAVAPVADAEQLADEVLFGPPPMPETTTTEGEMPRIGGDPWEQPWPEPAAQDGGNGEGFMVGGDGSMFAPADEGDVVAFAEEEKTDGVDEVDFASITGRAPAGAPGAVAELPALPKRRKRKESSPLARVIGCLVAGGLAILVFCYGVAYLGGPKYDDFRTMLRGYYVPGIPQNSSPTAEKTTPPAAVPAAVQTPAAPVEPAVP